MEIKFVQIIKFKLNINKIELRIFYYYTINEIR